MQEFLKYMANLNTKNYKKKSQPVWKYLVKARLIQFYKTEQEMGEDDPNVLKSLHCFERG